MILEKAAYLLSGQILNEAVCDKSIPNAVRWVTYWLAHTGRGKNPTAATGQTTRFNNTQYYRDNPNAITPEQKNEIETQVRTENPDASDSEIRRLVNRAIADRPHDQSIAEDLVERIVMDFSHPIDYCRKGDYKMFIEGITRIAFTECDYGTMHENKTRIELLKKCYLAATMMYINSKNPNYTGHWKNSFNNSCDLDGIGFVALCRLCKPAYDELLEQWQASKTAYENEKMRKKAIAIIVQEDGIEPADITEDQIITKIEELNNAAEEQVQANETPDEHESLPVIIPEITTDGPYANLPNPYMENAFRLGNYNCCLIPDYNASHTWLRFQNRDDDYPENDYSNAPYDGGVGWCISYGPNHWKHYKQLHSNVTIYFCWKDNFRDLDKHDYPEAYIERGASITADTEWGRSLICIQVYDDGNGWTFGRATSRYNHADGHGYRNGLGSNSDQFADFFVKQSEDGAKTLAEKYFGVSLEQFKKAFAVNYDPDNTNFVSHSEANFDDTRNYEILFYGTSNTDANIYVKYKHNNEYCVLCCGKPVNDYWYRYVSQFVNTNKYLLVRFADHTYNILNVETGRHCFPDNFLNINDASYSNNLVIVTLTNHMDNILNIETGRLMLRKPYPEINKFNIKQNIIICKEDDQRKAYTISGKQLIDMPSNYYVIEYSKYFIITKDYYESSYAIYKYNETKRKFEFYSNTDKDISTAKYRITPTLSSDGKSLVYIKDKKINFYNYDANNEITVPFKSLPPYILINTISANSNDIKKAKYMVGNKYGYITIKPYGYAMYDLMTGECVKHIPQIPDTINVKRSPTIMISEDKNLVMYEYVAENDGETKRTLFNLKTDKPIVDPKLNISHDMNRILNEYAIAVLSDNYKDSIIITTDGNNQIKTIPCKNGEKISHVARYQQIGNHKIMVMRTFVQNISRNSYGFDIYVDGSLIKSYDTINASRSNAFDCLAILYLTDSLAMVAFEHYESEQIFYIMINIDSKEVLFTDIFKSTILTSSSKPMEGAFYKVVSIPDDDSHVGKLLDLDSNEYYFNELGDCADMVESLEESLERKYRNNNILNLYESAAYFC